MLARLRIEEGRDFRDRLGSLVSYEGLFDRGQVFERSEDDPSPFLSADVFREPSELFSENKENFILVVELVLSCKIPSYGRPSKRGGVRGRSR